MPANFTVAEFFNGIEPKADIGKFNGVSTVASYATLAVWFRGTVRRMAICVRVRSRCVLKSKNKSEFCIGIMFATLSMPSNSVCKA